MIDVINFCRVGTDDVDYVTFSQREDLCTGGLSASVTTSCVHERWATETAIKLSSHCLDRNTEKMLDLWQELFHGYVDVSDWLIPWLVHSLHFSVNLNDDTRLRTLIRQSAQDLANGVAFNGHGFAMKSASQYLSPSASYEEMFSGGSLQSGLKYQLNHRLKTCWFFPVQLHPYAMILPSQFWQKPCFSCILFDNVDIVVKNIALGAGTREVWGSIPRPVKSDTVSSLLRCFFGAVLSRRWVVEMDLVTRYTLQRISSGEMKIGFWINIV